MDPGAAGEAPVAVLSRIEGLAQLLPVDQVLADGMAPVHVAPTPAVGIVLIEKMVLALVVNQPVGVVQPTS